MFKKPEDLRPFLVTIVLSLGFIFLFFIRINWDYIFISMGFSFIGILLLWLKKPFFDTESVLRIVNEEKYLKLRIEHTVGKNNLLSFSLLTYILVASSMTIILYPSIFFKNIYSDLEGSFVLDFFKILGGDYNILAFLLLFFTGLLLLYLTLSTFIRREFNRIIEIQKESYQH